MRTYAEPPATFVRGQGTWLFDAAGKEYLDFITGLAVVSLGHAHPASPRRWAAGPDLEPCVQPLRQHPGPRSGRHPRPAGQRRDGPGGRSGLLLQLGRRGQRVRPQVGPALGGRRPPCRGQRGQFVPRPDARHPARRPGSPRSTRRSSRSRRASSTCPTTTWRRSDAALDPDTGRRACCSNRSRERAGCWSRAGLPRHRARTVQRARRAAHARRDPDWPRADRSLVHLPGPGSKARRRDHGQGARQRDAGRRLLGTGRGGRSLRPGRPRFDLRRPAPGARRGESHVRGHGAGGRCRRARESGRVSPPGWASWPGVVSVRGADCSSPPSSRRRSPRRWPALALARGLLVNPVRPDAIRVAPPLLVRDAEIDAALRILGDALAEVAGPISRTAPRAPHAPPASGHQRGRPANDGQPLRRRRSEPGGVRDRVLELAVRTPAQPALAGQGVALLFEKPSVRTAQFDRDGGGRPRGPPVYIQGSEVGLDTRETAEDIARHARLLPPVSSVPRVRRTRCSSA